MKKYFILAVIILLIAGGCDTMKKKAENESKPIYTWPNNARAAVSLTYDDGMDSQFENAVPALKKYNLKATFFPTGDYLMNDAHAGEWLEIIKDGNEIGCHTINHACNKSKKLSYSLQDYTLQRMKQELQDNIDRLKKLGYVSGYYVFAYPCGDTFVGDNDESYIPLVKEKFLAARGVTWRHAYPDAIEMTMIPCFAVNGKTGPEMIELAKEAEMTNSWAVFLFHGVGGDWIPTDAQAHEELLKYLSDNRDKYWIAPFGEVAKYIKDNKK